MQKDFQSAWILDKQSAYTIFILIDHSVFLLLISLDSTFIMLQLKMDPLVLIFIDLVLLFQFDPFLLSHEHFPFVFDIDDVEVDWLEAHINQWKDDRYFAFDELTLIEKRHHHYYQSIEDHVIHDGQHISFVLLLAAQN